MPRLERIFAGAVLFFFAVAATQSAPHQRCDTWTARLVSTQGVVEVQYPNRTEWRATELGQTFCLGDRLRVQGNSRAALELANDTILRLDQKTMLLLPEAATEDDFWVDLFEGALYLLSRVKRSLEIRTPFVNAGLEGTEFVVRVLDDQTIVSVLEGKVAVSNALGRLSLIPGQTAAATKNSAPILRLELRTEDAVRWALYYPLILDPTQPGIDRAVLEAQRALIVGRASQARAQLDAILAKDPSNTHALALASIVALVQNATDQAKDLAERAVAVTPGDTSAQLALSYANQALFDLSGARAAANAAVESDPDDAIAWARLAEILASLDVVGAALSAARRAVELAPGLSRTQTVLGFVALMRLELDQAAASFETAIVLDPTDPLPRAGQALVKIRRGAVADGTRDLEIAVSLDPANSLARTYLGKAYFEQKRDREAGVEFERAKQLDPLDPTPWLYDALRKQADNDPIGALRNLEQSIALNDHRAVTRSRLLLDGDRSARTADQGQVFRELGFERLIPGITARSSILDPGSPGVHRLQADATRPREQSARVSDLLQWQLNAPLTTNLLQLQQTEANLVITSAADLVALSESEWSQMFSTDGPFLRFNAVAGSHDLLSNDLTLGYQAETVVFGVTQYHYEFDGFADNNDQTRDIYGASMQWQPSPTTVLFGEYRDDDQDFGDLSLGYGGADVAPDLHTSIDADRWRVGIRHQVRPDTQVIATVAGFNSTEKQRDRVFFPEIPMIAPALTTQIDAKTDDDGWLGELQVIRRWAPGALVAGAGYYDSDSDLKSLAVTDAEVPSVGNITIDRQTIRDDTNTQHTNAYAYWSASLLSDLDYTAGLAYDDYDGPELNRNQLSPKLGAIWRPAEGLQFRAVAARGLKRTLVAEQTVEPTQVAGFTQMFDDLNGTEARLYGIALDARPRPDLYLGGELRARDLKVPFTDVNGADERTDWDELTGALYAYWTPTDRLALRAELSYEDLDYDNRLPRPDKPWSTLSLDTIQLPISMSYSVLRGLTTRATARWVDQDAHLVQVAIPGQPRRRESDSFWTADLEFDYRLPKYYGRITIGAKNLFDQSFGYQEPDLNQPTLARERTFYVRLNLAL